MLQFVGVLISYVCTQISVKYVYTTLVRNFIETAISKIKIHFYVYTATRHKPNCSW
jgi:hypothetical protein